MKQKQGGKNEKRKDINKIAAIGLLMVIGLSIMVAQGLTGISPEYPPGRTVQQLLLTAVRVEIAIPFIPKVGEIFEATIAIYCINDLEYYKAGPDYKVCFEGDIEITEGREHIIYGYLKKGETRRFKAKMVIKEAKERVGIGGSIVAMRPVPFGQGAYIEMFLVDPETGQYGTKEEYDKRLRERAEWWYDPAGEFTGDPVHPDCAKKNREIITKIQEINSNLTDWEALYLHYDGIQALMGGMGTQETTDEERWRFLLEMGWLEQYKAGKAVKNNWLNKMIKKYEGKPLTKEQGLNPNFFRGDNWYNNSFFSYDSITKENLI